MDTQENLFTVKSDMTSYDWLCFLDYLLKNLTNIQNKEYDHPFFKTQEFKDACQDLKSYYDFEVEVGRDLSYSRFTIPYIRIIMKDGVLLSKIEYQNRYIDEPPLIESVKFMWLSQYDPELNTDNIRAIAQRLP